MKGGGVMENSVKRNGKESEGSAHIVLFYDSASLSRAAF